VECRECRTLESAHRWLASALRELLTPGGLHGTSYSPRALPCLGTSACWPPFLPASLPAHVSYTKSPASFEDGRCATPPPGSGIRQGQSISFDPGKTE